MRFLSAVLLCALPVFGETVTLPGLRDSVEILRDKWGVPHIYAKNQDDLFFAQGYVAARDRLFQIDLWRRVGTGQLAEVLGEKAIARDTLARAVRYRGDMAKEWESYSPDTRQIATAFTSGINAYIRSLKQRPHEFAIAGYDPALWAPQDVTARIAGLLMTRNLNNEVRRVLDIREFGLPTVERYLKPDPPIRVEVPKDLDLRDVNDEILAVYREATGQVDLSDVANQGSNNWVVDGTMTTTGKPLLANDPHRPVLIPALRKTVHLVGGGWNVFGAGEPALPGVALGHNESVAFGFTIVGIDQSDLYVERVNPRNRNQYLYKGEWKEMEVERQTLRVRGQQEPVQIELRYTLHGPVIHEDRKRNRAYAVKWVGTEPGTAGYLAGIALARARNWKEFSAAVDRYKVPSENLVYADTEGNIGWWAAGMAPIRPNWSGLLPVPGHTGEYEWAGFRRTEELPHVYNPDKHYVATANHNVLPPGYSIPLGYEWALPFRFIRLDELLREKPKFSLEDFKRIQQDVTAEAARRLQRIVRAWEGRPAEANQLLAWDARLDRDSVEAALYSAWANHLPAAVFGRKLGARVTLLRTFEELDAKPNPKALRRSLDLALADLARRLGPDRSQWRWGRLHTITFRHALGIEEFSRGPVERPGDGTTINSTSGGDYRQTNGASYRQIVDLADWDRSVMTSVPGESGDPASPHYDDLLEEWASGGYHPMAFSRKAVEAATVEKIELRPARSLN
ncbi:MAG: penicillin acylase family protein [Bryobacterales bacterium]|nr:penicillin acylase family protein [Bryobacterales bacterium]